jgi:hypothetical protein
VTLDHLEPPVSGSAHAHARRAVALAGDVAVLVALAWWATGLTWGTGGREPHVLSIGVGLTAVAALLVRPWRSLSRLVSLATLAPGAAGFLVCAFAPTGWAGADAAASWVYAGLMAAVAAAWARDERRRALLLCVAVLAPLGTFAKGWLAWWGGGNAAQPFVGTFYWHNQEAAFLLMGALCGLAIAVTAGSALRPLGWLAVALCGAGVFLTTSRGAMMALYGALTLLVVLGLARRAWRLSLAAVIAGAAAFVTATVLSGPPFFTHGGGALAGASARSQSGETLGANSGHRLDDWSQAVHVFLRWPVTGVGFHGFASGSALVDQGGKGSLTPFAHNGFLQLFVDGGVLLGAVALAALAVATLAIGRGLRPAVRTASWTPVVLATAVLAGALHSAIDFDWSYPALLSGFGLLLVLAAPAVAAAPAASTRWDRLVPALWAAVVVLAVIGAWHGGFPLSVQVTGAR